MINSQSRKEYLSLILKVQDHIEAYLYDPISLEKPATVAVFLIVPKQI